MNAPHDIPSQSSLPLRMAADIVMQGFRIRFGRSMITVFGVMLGIMFLIASATTFIISAGVKEEERLRSEAKRMHNTLMAEIGSVAERDIGVIQAGPLEDLERRLILGLAEENPRAILWASPAGQTAAPALLPQIRAAAVDDMADVKCVLIVGRGAMPGAALNGLATRQFAQPIAFTQIAAEQLPHSESLYTISITGKPTPEEQLRLAHEKRMARSRLIWILSISLLVTIISISNAMLMSVVERFREIGTMKCLGADSRFVRRLFLIESSLIGLFGGLGGALSGVLFTIAYHCAVYGAPTVLSSLNYAAIGVCLASGSIAGVILSVLAAIYPAGIASAMVPANALRSNA